jgi:hypothetical protein
MKLFAKAAVGALAGWILTAGAAQATVITSLPYANTPDWTDIEFPGTSMSVSGGVSTLTTGPGLGVWFGWGAWYGNQPAWSPSSDAVGNHLSMDLSFSGDARDWSAYFYDQSYTASMQFNPGTCPGGNCYAGTTQAGVNLLFGGGATPTTQFVALDLSDQHTFEFLLKGGQVSYRIDGTAYSGAAWQASLGAPLLVIGDGSGSDPSGIGSMRVHGISFDNAPTENVLVSTAPEPGAWALMLAGVGLAGAALRRRRKLAPALS